MKSVENDSSGVSTETHPATDSVPAVIPARASVPVQELFRVMRDRRITYGNVAAWSGVTVETIYLWRTRYTPRLSTIERALSAVGLEITVKSSEEGS